MHTISEIGPNVPAFLAKLWKMVEDPMTDNLISWCSQGDSFVIKNATKLARDLLPLYYKHNNMASFIRQLNMYGFHKIISSDCKQDTEEMKFMHPNFVQGHPYLLQEIKRKITITRNQEKPNFINKMLSDVRQMKGKQDNMDSKILAMKRENEALWRELSHMRQRHKKQQHIVNKLIQYLVMLIQTNHLPVTRRGFPLMLKDKAGHHNSSDDYLNSPTGPVIHELEADTLLDDVDSSTAEPTVSSSDSNSEVDIDSETLPTTNVLDGAAVETEVPPALEVLETNFPTHYITVGDKTIPVNIQNLTALSKDANILINEVPPAPKTKAKPKTRKRHSRSIIKTPLKKIKKEVPVQPVETIIDNANFLIVPDVCNMPLENKMVPSVTSVNADSPVQVSELPTVVAEDWTLSPTTLLYPESEEIIIAPEVESLMLKEEIATPSPSNVTSVKSIENSSSGTSDPVLNNMQVACMNSGKTGGFLKRFGRLEDVDDHVESVQADLDSFKDLLKTEGYSLDINNLLEFLNDDSAVPSCLITDPDDTYPNNFNKKDLEGNELMMYNPSVFDLSDVMDSDDWNLLETDDTQAGSQDDNNQTGLNTPQYIPPSPTFSTPPKLR